MAIGLQGQNLIFLISQPRAGSTLLQRILGSHSSICTASEPWLMLHPLYALRVEGYEAEYRVQTAREALQDFLQTLPGGEDEYIEGVRRMYAHLYERARATLGKRCFLDKTPRYYLIIPQLHRVFPQARYIILLRNPLAVLCSIYANWSLAELLFRPSNRLDLIEAPSLLLEGIKVLGNQGVVAHYEKLARNPRQEIQELCDHLGFDFDPAMLEYGRRDLPHWELGDKKVYNYAHPMAQIATEWIQILDDPQAWQLSSEYLDLLGEKTVERMGYSYRELQQLLETRRPRWTRLWFTYSLSRSWAWPVQKRTRWKRAIVQLTWSLRRRGIRGTMSVATQRIAQALSEARSYRLRE